MTRKIRYFERNVWLVQALRDEHVKWTVGPSGLQIQSAAEETSDHVKDWKKAVNEAYSEWCENPCLDATISMAQAHKQIAGSAHLENDLFILKTRLKTDGNKAIPKIQLVESHRCSAPGQQYSPRDAEDLVDGVQLGKDSSGRVIGPNGYWILDNLTGDQWAFRNTREMYHVFDPERIGMHRGITPYHSVMNSLHDLDDLEMMEMERAKQNSEVANILTNPSGEINQDNMRRLRFGGAAGAPVLDKKDDDVERRISLYRKILGSRTIALKTGEKLEQFGSESPSASTQWYWRYKIGQICRVAGVPLLAIFPELSEGIQGTVVRGVYDNAHEGFKGKFFIYGSAAVDIWRFFVSWAVHNDKRCVDAPTDWRSCHVAAPRAINVDIGYTSSATLAELEAGVTNWDDIAARYGTTAQTLIRKKAKNVKMIHEIAAEYGINAAEISAPIAEILERLAKVQAIENGGDIKDDDEDKKKEKKKKVAA